MAAPPSSVPAGAARPAERASGLAAPSALCLVLAVGLLFFVLPRGFALGGVRLDLPVQGALMGLAVAAGAWGAFSGQERRVLLGSGLALAFLLPAYDPRAPLERLPAYLAVAVLFLLHLELALLHAKITKLAKLPRAHVTHGGQSREVELAATASRIAGSWPTPLGLGLALVGAALALQFLLASVAPPQLGQSVEFRGPFGLALAGVLVLGLTGAFAVARARRALGAEAAAPAGPPGAVGAPGEGPPAPDASRP